jgi:hypothetical protein
MHAHWPVLATTRHMMRTTAVKPVAVVRIVWRVIGLFPKCHTSTPGRTVWHTVRPLNTATVKLPGGQQPNTAGRSCHS